jgi:(p)ppGpp synthase/HD superfamily hydrolase
MNLTARFENALVFAAGLHRQQLRKGTQIPYVSHLLAVTAIALEHGANEDEAIAALLHDAVEDQGGRPTLDQIRRRFGDPVARIVEGCTDSDATDPSQRIPWRERKERYVAHIAEASPSVLLVSTSDKLHNARSIFAEYRRNGENTWTKFKGGREGVLWYYRALVNAYRVRGTSPLLDELERTVAELEKLVGSRKQA